MTRAFTDREKELIKSALMDKGRELFLKFGLKKTSIEDITKAAGIAQGSFYAFFESKEDLYFEIVELEQNRFHAAAEKLLDPQAFSKSSFKQMLVEAFAFVESNPLIRNMYQNGEFEQLMRKLPADRMEKHIQGDAVHFLPLMKKLRGEGKMVDERPEVIIGLFRALLAVPFFRKEIGEDIYGDVVSLLCDSVVERIFVQKGES